MARRRKLRAETYRRLVLGDIRHLGRARYGTPLPDDDAGRDHIEAQLRHCSNVTEMRFEVTKYAPWLGGEAAGSLIDRISSMPRSLMSMRQIGEEFRVTNEERNQHHLYRIKPVDMTDEQLADQRKAKERERLERRRRTLGAEVREVWLATHSISRTKPWEKLI